MVHVAETCAICSTATKMHAPTICQTESWKLCGLEMVVGEQGLLELTKCCAAVCAVVPRGRGLRTDASQTELYQVLLRPPPPVEHVTDQGRYMANNAGPRPRRRSAADLFFFSRNLDAANAARSDLINMVEEMR